MSIERNPCKIDLRNTMNKIHNIKARMARIHNRNRGNLLRGLTRESLAKLCQNPFARKVITSVVPVRKPEKWLFVVGCYNSGTTILRRLIESHPSIGAMPVEGCTVTSAFPDLEVGGWGRMMFANKHLWQMDQDSGTDAANMAMHDWSLWWPRNATVFFEKSIDHTVRMEWLDRHFPNSYFISITRHGMCVCEGIARRAKISGQALDTYPNGYSPDLLADQWTAISDVIDASGPKVKNYLPIYYEQLMSEPVETLNSIFEFLDIKKDKIEYTDGILSMGKTTHKLVDGNPSSLARIDQEIHDTLYSRMHRTMTRHGYSSSSPARSSE